MSENTAATTEPVATVTDAPEPVEVAPEPDFAAEAAKWKAMSRKHEDQAKANADKAKRLDELEEASKSELEKVLARAEAAEKAAADAEAKVLRAKVAASKGVDESLLSGSTQEELEATADALLAWKGTTPALPSSAGQGNVGRPVNENIAQLTREDLKGLSASEILKAKSEGRMNVILGVKN